ncbi:hypothetical protein BLNAU_18666 [Blattamonas nauphoetae]|uniref:Uncharacterized protein n=1 Tax=Blattamonas nauphoetae TaxID=2049346 RepID=A0ABQ9X3R2_9EUKA|nr:hypothetical protein BLNAU_18666 [Blattamonas nauphoetae]
MVWFVGTNVILSRPSPSNVAALSFTFAALSLNYFVEGNASKDGRMDGDDWWERARRSPKKKEMWSTVGLKTIVSLDVFAGSALLVASVVFVEEGCLSQVVCSFASIDDGVVVECHAKHQQTESRHSSFTNVESPPL